MEEWEKLLIKDAFDKSPGLKESLKSHYNRKKDEMEKICIEHLAARSGMRIEFIEKHIAEIINL